MEFIEEVLAIDVTVVGRAGAGRTLSARRAEFESKVVSYLSEDQAREVSALLDHR
jgi:hypothetical protein